MSKNFIKPHNSQTTACNRVPDFIQALLGNSWLTLRTSVFNFCLRWFKLTTSFRYTLSFKNFQRKELNGAEIGWSCWPMNRTIPSNPWTSKKSSKRGMTARGMRGGTLFCLEHSSMGIFELPKVQKWPSFYNNQLLWPFHYLLNMYLPLACTAHRAVPFWLWFSWFWISLEFSVPQIRWFWLSRNPKTWKTHSL